MTFLAPWFLAAAGAAAAGVILFHLIALQRPPSVMFPTARFVPDRPARAASVTRRPTDRWLLLLRVVALLLIGTAFARPVVLPERQAVRRVVMVDRSWAVGSEEELRDSARAWLAPGSALVVFDSAAALAHPAPGDTLAALARTEARGNLTAAFVAGLRAASALRDSSDAIEMVIVSPFVESEFDAATLAVREEWPGTVQLVPVAAASADTTRGTLEVNGDETHPLAVAASFVGGGRAAGPSDVRIVTAASSITAPDTGFAEAGNVLIVWPDSGVVADWPTMDTPDTVGAVTASHATVVAPFARLAAAPDGNAIARWVDGAAAALEQPLGGGCIRTVSVPVDDPGDLVLRPAFHAFLAALTVQCGGGRDLRPVSDTLLATLAGQGSDSVTVSRAGAYPDGSLALWLLGAALAALLLELWVRRSGKETP